MGCYGGQQARNHGWGRNLAYAGKQVLAAHFGGGHFSSVASHGERWRVFTDWAKANLGLRDLRELTPEMLSQYAQALQAQGLAVATIQNRLSTINVVMAYAREGRWEAVSPRALASAARSAVRTEVPVSLDLQRVDAVHEALRTAGLERAAAVFGLARAFGMRSEEAVKADLDRLAREAGRLGKINILDGAKGGRRAPRWVSVTARGQQALAAAIAARSPGAKNLLRTGESYRDWRQGELRAGREVLHRFGLRGYHDARAAFACERYLELTGSPAPVVTDGQRQADQATDRVARECLAEELGHGRTDVVAAYVGSAR